MDTIWLTGCVPSRLDGLGTRYMERVGMSTPQELVEEIPSSWWDGPTGKFYIKSYNLPDTLPQVRLKEILNEESDARAPIAMELGWAALELGSALRVSSPAADDPTEYVLQRPRSCPPEIWSIAVMLPHCPMFKEVWNGRA